ncbi:MAG: LytTR family transcriptional regulator [Muribaculum sp.]|nr:LytTR family transcriptional regulator [Muribaculum sp.]
MIVNIFQIKKDEKERLEIYCHEESSEITEIVRFVKSRQGQLTGITEGAQYEIPVSDVFYMEGVDNKVFIYCEKQVYETRQRLYELEEALKEKTFSARIKIRAGESHEDRVDKILAERQIYGCPPKRRTNYCFKKICA